VRNGPGKSITSLGSAEDFVLYTFSKNIEAIDTNSSDKRSWCTVENGAGSRLVRP
jgi:hypothetical protein